MIKVIFGEDCCKDMQVSNLFFFFFGNLCFEKGLKNIKVMNPAKIYYYILKEIVTLSSFFDVA